MNIPMMNENIGWLEENINLYEEEKEVSRFSFFTKATAAMAKYAADQQDYFLRQIREYPDSDIYRERYDAYNLARDKAERASLRARAIIGSANIIEDSYLDEIADYMVVNHPVKILEHMNKYMQCAKNKGF